MDSLCRCSLCRGLLPKDDLALLKINDPLEHEEINQNSNEEKKYLVNEFRNDATKMGVARRKIIFIHKSFEKIIERNTS